MKNPYFQGRGFGLRRNYAEITFRRYGADVTYPIFTRTFDNCFENHDGDAVVFALMNKAEEELASTGHSSLMEGIKRMFGGEIPARWQQIARPETGQTSLFTKIGEATADE